jgi:hypothetical protein
LGRFFGGFIEFHGFSEYCQNHLTLMSALPTTDDEPNPQSHAHKPSEQLPLTSVQAEGYRLDPEQV